MEAISKLYQQDTRYGDGLLKPQRWCHKQWSMGASLRHDIDSKKVLKMVGAVVAFVPLVFMTLTAYLVGFVGIAIKSRYSLPPTTAPILVRGLPPAPSSSRTHSLATPQEWDHYLEGLSEEPPTFIYYRADYIRFLHTHIEERALAFLRDRGLTAPTIQFEMGEFESMQSGVQEVFIPDASLYDCKAEVRDHGKLLASITLIREITIYKDGRPLPAWSSAKSRMIKFIEEFNKEHLIRRNPMNMVPSPLSSGE